MSIYKVKLENFEGPLDLLLFFIRRDELNIYDIPINHITKEFLSYVHYIQKLDLEIAGEFIYMASYLLSIKSRMLLPQAEQDGDAEPEDPRAELVRRLLEYKLFKEMASVMEQKEADQSFIYKREFFDGEVKMVDEVEDVEIGVTLKDITLWDLMLVYKQALQNQPKQTFHQITKISTTIEDQILLITEWVETKQRFAFTDLVLTIMHEKIVVVVTFLAILEMTKLGKISLLINEDLSDFYVIKREAPLEEDDVIEEEKPVNE